jgi:hypothetical protein
MRVEVFYGHEQGWQVRVFPVGEAAEEFGLEWPVQPQAGNPARDEAERELDKRGWKIGPYGWSGDILNGGSWAEVIPARDQDPVPPPIPVSGVSCQPARSGQVMLAVALARIVTGRPRGTGRVILQVSDAEMPATELLRAARQARGGRQ